MTSPPEPRRPNILLLMTDEHGAQFSGSYGHPFIRTPAMDRLAAEGVTFDAAYCNNPLCVPSRLSFMTGRHTHNCAGWDNATPLAPDAVTWPHLLRAQGYEVALSGKMHLVGDDHLHGFQEQLARDLHCELEHPIFPWEQGIPEAREPWPGVVRTASRVPPGPDGEEAEAGGEDAATPPTGPGRTPEIDADDEAVTAALAFLRRRAQGDAERPFALCVGLIAPHFPFVVPEPFFSQYFPRHADLPHLPPGHLAALPPAARRLRRAFGFSGHTELQVRRARAAYYGLVSYADDKLRQLLEALDECGLADDTLVIHTSDHGEMLGEHGLWRKMSFYEQSARVPLQVRWPGRAAAGRHVGECVSLVDVTATMVEAAGAAAAAAPMDGHSLSGLLAAARQRGRPADWPAPSGGTRPSPSTPPTAPTGHGRCCGRATGNCASPAVTTWSPSCTTLNRIRKSWSTAPATRPSPQWRSGCAPRCWRAGTGAASTARCATASSAGN